MKLLRFLSTGSHGLDVMVPLLTWGAAVNYQLTSGSLKGPTALHVACRYGRVENAAFLLRQGANPGMVESSGVNCFHIAAAREVTGKTQNSQGGHR